jgi:hypothetical protein
MPSYQKSIFQESLLPSPVWATGNVSLFFSTLPLSIRYPVTLKLPKRNPFFSTQRVRQKALEFEASLGFVVRPQL